MSTADDLVGSVGRVSGRVAAGTTGEVLLYHYGITGFLAYPADPDADIAKNALVIVTDYDPTRGAVIVAEDASVTANCAELAPPPV